jgi:lysozyme
MITSQKGSDFIAEIEGGFKLKAYPDPKTGGAPWTCGAGCTGRDIGPDTVWSLNFAQLRFAAALASRESVINNEIAVPLTQGQFDALVSILYNVGYGSPAKDGIFMLKNGQPSTLIRKLRAGDYAGASAEFPKWCSPGTNVENGLRRRRLAEQAMFDGVAS